MLHAALDRGEYYRHYRDLADPVADSGGVRRGAARRLWCVSDRFIKQHWSKCTAADIDSGGNGAQQFYRRARLADHVSEP